MEPPQSAAFPTDRTSKRYPHMIYEIGKTSKLIAPEQIDPGKLTVACVTPEELAFYGKAWGFDAETIEASRRANPLFRTGAEVHRKYTFSELRIVNRDGSEDYVSLFIKKNFVVLVDIVDDDSSTVSGFMNAVKKYPFDRVSEEKLILAFFESLLSDGSAISESLHNELSLMEESIVNGQADEYFNVRLMALKKRILKYYNYYSQILDVTEMLEENENDILAEERLINISNLSARVHRRADDMTMLTGIADHLQDAYATLLDQRMNNTMKAFTLITTIFFPLTIIVGWYGMNFMHMPELAWRYGYIYVTLLSVAVVVLLVIIGRKKKWF